MPALLQATAKEQNITIKSSGGLSDADIEKMVREAEQFATADKARKDAIEAKNELETAIYSAEKSFAEYKVCQPARISPYRFFDEICMIKFAVSLYRLNSGNGVTAAMVVSWWKFLAQMQHDAGCFLLPHRAHQGKKNTHAERRRCQSSIERSISSNSRLI